MKGSEQKCRIVKSRAVILSELRHCFRENLYKLNSIFFLNLCAAMN